MNDDSIRANYVREVGHEPRNLPKDHPDLWQWRYIGRSEFDKDRLAELLEVAEAEPVDQEALF